MAEKIETSIVEALAKIIPPAQTSDYKELYLAYLDAVKHVASVPQYVRFLLDDNCDRTGLDTRAYHRIVLSQIESVEQGRFPLQIDVGRSVDPISPLCGVDTNVDDHNSLANDFSPNDCTTTITGVKTKKQKKNARYRYNRKLRLQNAARSDCGNSGGFRSANAGFDNSRLVTDKIQELGDLDNCDVGGHSCDDFRGTFLDDGDSKTDARVASKSADRFRGVVSGSPRFSVGSGSETDVQGCALGYQNLARNELWKRRYYENKVAVTKAERVLSDYSSADSDSTDTKYCRELLQRISALNKQVRELKTDKNNLYAVLNRGHSPSPVVPRRSKRSARTSHII